MRSWVAKSITKSLWSPIAYPAGIIAALHIVISDVLFLRKMWSLSSY